MKAKRGLLAAFALLMGGAAAAGAVAAYYWQRATAVPTWYVSHTADGDWATNVGSSRDLWQYKFATGEVSSTSNNGQVEVRFTEAEFNQLLRAELSQAATTDPLMAATQSIQASLAGDRLQVGVMVNPAELPLQDLPPETQRSLQRTLNSVPLLENREFYVGITGNPRVENGQLVLDDTMRFQIGNIQLSLAEAARMAGVDAAQLTESLNRAIAQSDVTLDDLNITDGQIILRGTAP